jgi:hypothetical protein
MKTVEIKIVVEVSDNAKFLAVDRDGHIYEYQKIPVKSSVISAWDIRNSNGIAIPVDCVLNWEETLTEVPK